MPPRPLVQVLRLGLLSFRESEALQQHLVLRHHQRVREENQENQENHQRVREQSHALLLVQHPPTFTTGLRCLPYPPPLLEGLRQTGAEVQRCSRGGLITFHGPGQLVCYPILHLGSFKKSVRWYVCELEQTVLSVCRRFGIEASTSPHTGVWVGDNKICAIGIHCGRYVTSHGFALNCNTDLSWFDHIVPCGIEGKGVTSLSAELQRDVSVEEAIPVLLEAFRERFNVSLSDVSLTSL
ncbi:putative lipoyltransferase 2, mitochondrial [Trematomus bernacchii]|uniref:putative lipoyltransferase 2, mitochondrial n=1 Tax=Trematomus bernacchii TaxID=40690 RepID=UPI00146DA94E|nr:putative lipoyltransferase 2, mitochondrial [Trematomus bernacchii]XP_034004155.1 putative lipoyltransferase 2, mitochondrial [Trematomus bernacchii]